MAHLLPPGELEFCPPEGLNAGCLVVQLGADGHDGLTDVHTGHCALWLAPGTSHSSLEPKGGGGGGGRGGGGEGEGLPAASVYTFS